MSTIINVKCDDITTLYFRKGINGPWQLLTSPAGPSIDTQSSGSITYEFLKDSSSTYDVIFKDTGTTLPTSGGPTKVVASGDSDEVSFAKDEPAPTYYGGYVTVSEDAR